MINIILVGIGGFANAWIPEIMDSPEVDFAGFVEINPKTIAQQVKEYGFPRELIFPTLEDAFEAVDADGVINVTPPAVHKPVSLIALEQGLPVLSEKPLADSMASAQNIVEKSNQTGVLHMVAQDYRYKVPFQTLKAVLETGELGAVDSLRVDFYKGPQLKGGFHDQLPYPLLQDMSIHHFDLMRYLLGSNLTSVSARSWAPRWNWFEGESAVSAILEFENQVAATYNASWCGTGQETSWNGDWRFDCENGVLLLKDDQVYLHRRTEKLEDFGVFKQFINEDLDEVLPLDLEFVGRGRLLHEFVEAITKGNTPETVCQDNIVSLKMVFDVIEAAKLWN